MLSKWKPTKVNGKWCMARCLHINTVKCRPMTRWERWRWFWLKDDVTSKRETKSEEAQTSSSFLCLCKKREGWVTMGKMTGPCPNCGRVYFGHYDRVTLQIQAIEQETPTTQAREEECHQE